MFLLKLIHRLLTLLIVLCLLADSANAVRGAGSLRPASSPAQTSLFSHQAFSVVAVYFTKPSINRRSYASASRLGDKSLPRHVIGAARRDGEDFTSRIGSEGYGADRTQPELRRNWADPLLFADFDKTRGPVRTTTRMLAAHLLAPFVSNRSRVLEIGSGFGELQHWIGNLLPGHWIEADAEVVSLQQPRSQRTAKVVLLLPAIPFVEESFDLVIGLGVLDVISVDDIRPVLQEAFRVLKPGGRIIHMLDLIPNDEPDIEESLRQGFLMVPETQIAPDGQIRESGGGYYIDLRAMSDPRIRRRISKEDWALFGASISKYQEDSSEDYIDSPRLQFIESTAERLGIISRRYSVRERPFYARLSATATSVGFKVEKNDHQAASSLVARLDAPQMAPDVNVVMNRYGFFGWTYDPAVPFGLVKLYSALHLFIAQKPLESGRSDSLRKSA